MKKAKNGKKLVDLANEERGFTDWLNARKTTEPKSLKTMAVTFGAARRFADEHGFKGKAFLDLSVSEAAALGRAMKGSGFSPSIYGVVRSFLKANDKGKQADCFRISSKQSAMDPETLLTTDEVNRIIDAANNYRDRALLLVMADSGCRIHEVCALRFKDVEPVPAETPDGKVVAVAKVFFHKVKVRGTERYVELGPEASEALLRWCDNYPKDVEGDGSKPLFPSNSVWHYGSFMNPGSWQERIKYFGKLAELPEARVKDLHCHMFRHYRATQLLKAGVPEALIKKRLGWDAKSLMLAKYGHLVDEDVSNAMRALNGLKANHTETEKLKLPTRDVPLMPQVGPPVNLDKVMEQAKAEIRKELYDQMADLAAMAETVQEQLDKLKAMKAAKLPHPEDVGL